MTQNLLLSISVNYWQEFQDTLARVMDANLYVLDVNGNFFSQFSKPLELCQKVNDGENVCNQKCLNFYETALESLEDKDVLTCPYGVRIYACRLGTYYQKIGFLMISSSKNIVQSGDENEKIFITKANSIYQTINEVIKALLEKNLLGLQRLELNSIYEISRLMTSVVELDKVLDIVINSLIIIYKAEMSFVGLREADKVVIAQAKGEYSNQLYGKEWPLEQPLIEKVFSKVEHLSLSLEKFLSLSDLTGVDVPPGKKVMLFPLWSPLGAVGMLGIITSDFMDSSADRNLQIYVNFAAVALSNAKLIDRLEKEAETDFLTGFLNKRALRNLLIVELERIIRYGKPMSVIFLDVDNFKSYNDTFGHVAGDIVLQKTAEIIKNSIRLVDVAGRYGGEEFVIILPGTPAEGALAVAERIRKTIESYPFPRRKVTVSMGVASAQKNDSLDSLLIRADQACYQAKMQGKNRVCLDSSLKQ